LVVEQPRLGEQQLSLPSALSRSRPRRCRHHVAQIAGHAGNIDRKPEAFMGGFGSGWQGSKKATVDGSLVLTASSLVVATQQAPSRKHWRKECVTSSAQAFELL
jgi:hypothetical protein